MFSCRACTRRALTVLFETPFTADVTLTTRRLAPSQHPGRFRTYATAARTAREPRETELASNPGGETEENDDPRRKVSRSMEWTVKKHLEHLHDPFFIARHVELTLAKGHFDEAALLVRTASKDFRLAVSWNHLIDYQMREHKLNSAIKLFNEMKKRSQLPNDQTYTIIFRGCAESPHKELAVKEAVRIFHNMMSGPDNRLKPNTIHLNAVLLVCARANDLDTLFSILNSAGGGSRPANSQTYTTILNAIRAQVDKPAHPDLGGEAGVEGSKQQVIQRARQIWDEVISKWRSANLILDEELVCAMGRILLMGSYHDNVSVLDLIEQTMKIPKDEQALNAAFKDFIFASKPATEETAKPEVLALHRAWPQGFRPSSMIHAQPGNNSLSLVISALFNTRKTTLGPRYWTVFTKIHSVEPDAENWHGLFTLLCRGKNSTKAVEYLSLMPKPLRRPKNFRIAMWACLSDNLYRGAFNNATRVLELMLTSMRIPDLQTLRIYLRVAYASKRQFEEMAKKDLEGAKLAWGKQLTIALDNLWEPYTLANKQFCFGGLGVVAPSSIVGMSDQQLWLRDAAPRAELVALARKMVSAYDRLIFDNMVPFEVTKRLKNSSVQINRSIVKYFEDRDKFEPGGSKKVGALDEMADDGAERGLMEETNMDRF